jgi:hypothetical protein
MLTGLITMLEIHMSESAMGKIKSYGDPQEPDNQIITRAISAIFIPFNQK